MAILPPMVGPRAALRDLTAFLRQRSREQVIAGSAAVLVTVIIVIIFFVDSKINTAPPPQIVYVENYRPNRTDADIIRRPEEGIAEERARRRRRAQGIRKAQKKQFGIE
jgi:hypothetical protein